MAAIIVVLGHMPKAWVGISFSHFYLAVDLFFVLSGFVLSRAYEGQLSDPLNRRGFIFLRYLRLYPLYAVGTSIGLASAFAAYRLGRGELTEYPLVATVISAVLFLPSPYIRAGAALAPINAPAWSLLYEIAANILHAFLLVRLSTRSLALLVLCSATAVIWVDLHLGSLHTGYDWGTVGYGVIRVGHSYIVGVLIARLAPHKQRASLYATVLPFVLPVLVAGHGFAAPVTELFDVLLAFPALVFFSAAFVSRGRRLFDILGKASYPLYTISVPLITLASRALHYWSVDDGEPRRLFGCLLLAGMFLLSVALARWDEIIRRRILGRVSQRYPYRIFGARDRKPKSSGPLVASSSEQIG